MKKFFTKTNSLLSFIFIFWSLMPLYAQVTLSTSPTISFSNASGFGDNIAADGDGGSTAISDINIQTYPVNNSGTLLTADPLQYHDGTEPGWEGYPAIITYGAIDPNYGWIIKSSDGSNFSLISLGFLDWGDWTGYTFRIEAFDGGVSKGTFNFTSNTDGNLITLSQTSGSPSFKLPAAFGNVDQVEIYEADGNDSYISLNNIKVGPAQPALPVTWVSFNAEENKNTYNWQWQTATEQNVAYYIPQYSIDGTNYISAGKIAALGNNHTYQFNQTLSYTGTVFVRVEEVDIDSHLSYSKTLPVISSSNNGFSFYPNPAQSSIYIQWPYTNASVVSFSIYDVKGSLVKKQTSSISPSIKMDLTGLTTGTYFISCTDDQGHQSSKQTILKVAE